MIDASQRPENAPLTHQLSQAVISATRAVTVESATCEPHALNFPVSRPERLAVHTPIGPCSRLLCDERSTTAICLVFAPRGQSAAVKHIAGF